MSLDHWQVPIELAMVLYFQVFHGLVSICKYARYLE